MLSSFDRTRSARQNYMYTHCERWFELHTLSAYKKRKISSSAHAKDGKTRPTATVQTYVLAKYNYDINRMIHEEFMEWKALMKRRLVSSFWEEVKDENAEFMMVLITQIFMCHYSNVLTSTYGGDMLSSLSFLGN